MNEILQWLTTIIVICATAQKVGKYMDFRIGLSGISVIKKKARLEKHWSAFAKQSMERFSSRVIVVTEFQFSKIFGERILSLNSIARFVIFSIFLNCMLAFWTIIAAAPPGQLMPYLVKPNLLRIVGLLVSLNVPLDLIAYIFVRFAIRAAHKTTLSKRMIFIAGSITASYCIAVLSTTLGGVFTVLALTNWALGMDSAVTILLNWLELALLHPFTSQMSLNGLNVGFVAIGALPSIFVLSVTLIYMMFLSTIARWVHREACINFGRILDEKKSFFELMALVFSAMVAAAWLVSQILSWLLSVPSHYYKGLT